MTGENLSCIGIIFLPLIKGPTYKTNSYPQCLKNLNVGSLQTFDKLLAGSRGRKFCSAFMYTFKSSTVLQNSVVAASKLMQMHA